MSGPNNDTTEKEESQPERFFFYEPQVAAPMVAGRRKPRMFSARAWSKVAVNDENEAIARAGHFVFQGMDPDQALETALDGMRRDMAKVERHVSWVTVLQVARGWPGPSRRRDGTYRNDIMDLAEKIEALGDLEAAAPGSVPDVMAHIHRWPDDEGFARACQLAFAYSVAHWKGEVPKTEKPHQIAIPDSSLDPSSNPPHAFDVADSLDDLL